MFVFLEKGLMMAIARVSSFDFTTPESMRNALQRYMEEREKIFPHLELSMCVNTGPSSFVDIAVYPNQKMADSNNCLLYTSPSPRDISGSRMPSSA